MRDSLPPGWESTDGVLKPGVSVGAYAARGQAVKGVCRVRGCNRRIVLDPDELCLLGLGRLSIEAVKRLWRCSRLDGCALTTHDDEMARPLRLGALAGRAHVRVRLRCRGTGCKFYRVWRVEEMISGLAKRGRGGDGTEVAALPELMTSPCPLCRKVNWAADVLWANTDTQGWQAMGEKWFHDRSSRG